MKGLKEGEGTFKAEDGTEYSGGWVAGKKHGKGSHTDADGTKHEVTFEQGN